MVKTKSKTKSLALVLALSFGLPALAVPARARQAAEPSLLKRTINITPRRFLVHWKNPAASEPVYNTWSWVPVINFAVNGPVPGGSQITVEFDTPDGKPWLTYKMKTPTLEPDFWETVEMEDPRHDAHAKQAITTPAGLFPFRIKIKNALSGTGATLFSGKYKISTYAPDQKIPEYKGKREFYVDEDWRLPMAWLWLDPTKNEDAPILKTQIWFRNTDDSDKVEAFLFHNGKQIASSLAGSDPETTLTNGVDEQPYRWLLHTFYFYKTRGLTPETDPQRYPEAHFLDKNPGEYEIKVVRGGDLARSLKFTVGADGKIVDNGVVKQNKIGGIRMLVPVQVIGAGDGKWDANAWKTDAFYGNPPAGFAAVP
jgi:hypothetical protein